MFHKSESKIFYFNNALNRRINNYFITDLKIKNYPIYYMNDYIPNIKSILLDYLKEFKNLSFSLNLKINVKNKVNKNIISLNYSCKVIRIYNDIDIDDLIKDAFIDLQNKIENDIKWKSNNIYNYVETHFIGLKVYEFRPKFGKKYLSLPKELYDKKCIINPNNKDNLCFLYSVIIGLYYDQLKDHRNLVWKLKNYLQYLKYDLADFKNGFEIKNIPKFEKMNNININVFSYDLDEYKQLHKYTLFLWKNNFDKKINLLYVESENHDNNHFMYINNINGFLKNKNDTNSSYYCLNCLYGYKTYEKLKFHESLCLKNDICRLMFPTKNKNDIIKFKNIKFKWPINFKIYLDFECILEKCEEKNKCILKYQQHKILGFMLFLVCDVDNWLNKIYKYIGENAAEEFFKSLSILKDFVYNIIKNEKKQIIMTDEDKTNFNKNNICHICEQYIIKSDYNYKVRDHCHITGKYRGPAHYICNINYKQQIFLPIYIHNLKYDSNIIFDNIENFLKENNFKISCIPITTTKYLSFSFRDKNNFELRFLDTYSFLPYSLHKLSKNLNDDKKKYLYNNFNYLNDEQIKILNKKWYYPYDYIDNINKIYEWKLPDITCFYNLLNKESIWEKKYNRCIEIFNMLKCENIKDYIDIYLCIDVLILADIFENFIDTSKIYYDIDPQYFYSCPWLTYQAALKYWDVEIKLITKENIFLEYERWIIGGLSFVWILKYIKNNNKYLPDFDKNKQISTTLYIDANSLYSTAMTYYLPYEVVGYSDFEKWNKEKILNYDFDTSWISYNFIVDIYIEDSYHDYYKNLPLFPINREIEDIELWDYQIKILKENKKEFNKKNNKNKDDEYYNDITLRTKQKKLIVDLYEKKDYFISGILLQYFLSLPGVVLKKINRVIKFKQKPFLKEYINFNIEKRKQNKNNEYLKQFFKDMCNQLYGKFIENKRSHRIIEFITNENYEKFLKISNQNLLKDSQIINEKLVLIERLKRSILMNKPIYIGSHILSLSKLIMYKFFYSTLIPIFKIDNLKLNYIDTDSFIFTVFNIDDVYKKIHENKEYFDVSELTHNKYFINEKGEPKYTENSKVLGKFKIENKGYITEFIGLRSKMYSYKTYIDNNNIYEEKRCKGIKKSVVDNELNFNLYYNWLFNNKIYYNKQNTINMTWYKISSIETEKISLSWFDDKMYMIDPINSLPHGHKNIKKLFIS